jgi:hypothetical protein
LAATAMRTAVADFPRKIGGGSYNLVAVTNWRNWRQFLQIRQFHNLFFCKIGNLAFSVLTL